MSTTLRNSPLTEQVVELLERRIKDIEACRELLQNDIAILLVEQNIHVAGVLAERIYVLVSGRTVYESPTAEFLVNPDLRLKYLGV